MAGPNSWTGDGPVTDPLLPDRGRPRHSHSEADQYRVRILAACSVAAVLFGLVYAVMGLIVGSVALGIGLGVAIAGATVCVTCFIVADREGWAFPEASHDLRE